MRSPHLNSRAADHSLSGGLEPGLEGTREHHRVTVCSPAARAAFGSSGQSKLKSLPAHRELEAQPTAHGMRSWGDGAGPPGVASPGAVPCCPVSLGWGMRTAVSCLHHGVISESFWDLHVCLFISGGINEASSFFLPTDPVLCNPGSARAVPLNYRESLLAPSLRN